LLRLLHSFRNKGDRSDQAMCGIAGIVGEASRDTSVIRAMTGAVTHRGPDDEGAWIDPQAGVALGHRRLAIVDLSPAGHQPMLSASDRFVITFNGEIYNHHELRAELDDAGAVPQGGWQGHSDTEVLLQAIETWGLEATLGRCAGMFAFALWDRSQRVLSLVRDRFGEKPLYYGWAGRDLVFASELKAIRAHPRFDGEIDRGALRLYASRSYIPAPLSIYKRLFKLPPGCILRFTLDAARTPLDQPPQPTRYWSYRDVVRSGLADPIRDETEALDALERTLSLAIGQQAMADVPVGAFLSGGIDSSTIVALYQKHSSIPVRTFSIGFEEAAFNEADDAKAVARHLGTVHHEHYVSADEARDVIPFLPAIHDEPFGDSSQIPTHLVSQFARGQVTVALTGDGGDELFGGYSRHFTAPRLWSQLRRVPRPLRAFAGSSLGHVPSHVWSRAGQWMPGGHQVNFGSKFQKALRVAATADSFDDIYLGFLDEWSFGRSPVIGGADAGLPLDLDVGDGAPDSLRMMYCDAVSYLPGDILCKVDRAAMAVSLETRLPFLDHRVAALAARIPLSMKIGESRGKLIVRRLLDRHVPRRLVERPKAGFAVPVGEWIKGPLRDWAESLLDPGAMRAAGWVDPDVVLPRWREHLSGRRDSTAAIWTILMFQAWARDQQAARAVAA
jgi:asparagine synthase (glutamine-hydrolysing)